MTETHQHNNPSPSHCVAAWCRGGATATGCGELVPLYDFHDLRPDGSPHQTYFIDGRSLVDLTHAIAELPGPERERLMRGLRKTYPEMP